MTDLASLSHGELEALLEEYPWFTLARKEYLWRQGEMGDEALRSAVAGAGLYLPSRAGFLQEVESRRREAIRKRKEAEEARKRRLFRQAGLCRTGGGRAGFRYIGPRVQSHRLSSRSHRPGGFFRGAQVRKETSRRRRFLHRDTGPYLLRAGVLSKGHRDLRKTNFGISPKKCLLCSPYR